MSLFGVEWLKCFCLGINLKSQTNLIDNSLEYIFKLPTLTLNSKKLTTFDIFIGMA